ncbi:hypothetical protein ZOD2009_06554 [Haladaptatus paucihalophilus DX253]|uniref:Uncharacterized protein n=1 Tax=Haladaptatus paucihalophilus DX253 TaxID=797209 RepID=E7QR88_HALPU|nr:hypothetical protein [Haladaptatus paucihalophilus]EFW92996.1 hypothetical protein ZOD2009_06554 [Haladaptatus paucihalophilus DX253]SHL17233.1 hypothetical protein SAMN05444342_3125 [Haladaptatus paucihalophilus DX253]
MMRLVGRAVGRVAGYVGGTFRNRRSRERLLLTVGVTSLLLAFVVVFAPWAVPEATVKPLVGWLADPTTVLLLAGAGGLLAIWSLGDGVTDERDEIWQPRTDPERAHYDEHRTSGSDVDDGLGLSGNLGLESRERRSRRATTRRHVRRAAVETLAGDGYTKTEARERLEDGSWTDDPRAAAFFGASSADIPLRTRITDWARGQTFDRRTERAVSELRERNGGESK